MQHAVWRQEHDEQYNMGALQCCKLLRRTVAYREECSGLDLLPLCEVASTPVPLAKRYLVTDGVFWQARLPGLNRQLPTAEQKRFSTHITYFRQSI